MNTLWLSFWTSIIIGATIHCMFPWMVLSLPCKAKVLECHIIGSDRRMCDVSFWIDGKNITQVTNVPVAMNEARICYKLGNIYYIDPYITGTISMEMLFWTTMSFIMFYNTIIT